MKKELSNEPYGPDWMNRIKKLPKPELVEMYKKVCIEQKELAETAPILKEIIKKQDELLVLTKTESDYTPYGIRLSNEIEQLKQSL
jgi:hypothetical protein